MPTKSEQNINSNLYILQLPKIQIIFGFHSLSLKLQAAPAISGKLNHIWTSRDFED